MISEQNKLEQRINLIKEKLKHLPPGKLICSKNGKYHKWFHSDGHATNYIPKEKRKYAEALAVKTYLTLLLEDLEKEKRAIQYYIRHSSPNGRAEKLLDASSGYRELLEPYFTPVSDELALWANASYERNQRYPEQLMHDCLSGNSVRSKSEVMIDTSLFHHNIPFRYENALKLDKQTIYPDFTIRHPKNGEIYYWEHFGMMDDPVYSKNAFAKLQLYTDHGIIPTINLITTYETKEHPLSMDVVEKMVTHYFLD